jgi:hypothetical protein
MRPKKRLGPSIGWATLTLVVIAASAAQLAISDPANHWQWTLLTVVGYATAARLLKWIDHRRAWLSQPRPHGATLTRSATAFAVVLVAAPLVEGFGQIWAAAHFRPLEQVTIVALMNLAFLAAALPRVPRCAATAVAISFVLVLAAVTLGDHPFIVPAAAAWAGLAAGWLAQRYWTRLGATTSGPSSRSLPIAPVVVVMVLMAGVTGGAAGLASGLPAVWSEWAPSSGGSRAANADALLGVGTGDGMVAGPNAQGTGAVNSPYFLESDLPTLYDVMTEAYGEPKPPDEVQRAIFVDQEQLIQRPGQPAPDDGEAGRQFCVYRQQRHREHPPAGNAATALLYVEGRVPVHLALAVYDRFDGVSWHPALSEDKICRVDTRNADVSWMWLTARTDQHYFGRPERRQLRFGRLNTERLPFPNHVERFRLGASGGDHLRRWAVEMFRWAQEGIVASRRCLPAGTYLEVVSRPVDQAVLAAANPFAPPASTGPHLAVPSHLGPSVAGFAERFSQLPRGWHQVAAVVDHLQRHYQHDRDGTLPADCSDPIHYFVQESRCGPAYQFATVAALTLRHLGYPTRVVSGFYARPEDYSARTGQTAVNADDLHFWIEVQSADGTWLTTEVTPGFTTAWYRPTLLTRVNAGLNDLWNLLVRYPVPSIAAAALIFAVWWWRLRLRERCLTILCLWSLPWISDRRLVRTLQLLDLRSRLAGRPRPRSTTPLAWYGALADPAARPFVSKLYEVLYAAPAGPGIAGRPTDGHAVCRDVVRGLSANRLRQELDRR